VGGGCASIFVTFWSEETRTMSDVRGVKYREAVEISACEIRPYDCYDGIRNKTHKLNCIRNSPPIMDPEVSLSC